MVKKILFYLFVVLSLAGAVYGYFYLNKNKEPISEITDHLPSNAMLVIQTNNFADFKTKLVHQNLIWNALQTDKNVNTVNSCVKYFDSLRIENEELKNLLEDNSFYWSIYKENKSFQHLLLIKLKEQVQEPIIEDYLKTHYQKNNTAAAFDIYEFTISGVDWYTSVKNGLLYFSTDIGLLEKSITLPLEESMSSDKNYRALNQSAGFQANSIYINHQMSSFIDKRFVSGYSIYSADVQLNAFNFTGYSIIDSISFFNAFSNHDAKTIKQYDKLPINPSRVFALGFSDLNTVYNQLLSVHQINDEVGNAWQNVSDSAMYDIKKEMLENINGELAYANYFINSSESMMLSLSVSDESKLQHFIKLISDSIIAYPTNKVYKVNSSFNQLFSFLPYCHQLKYYLVEENNLFGFSDEQALTHYLNSVSSGLILGKNKAFLEYANDNMNQLCNFLYYENLESVRANNSASILKLPELIYSEKAIKQIAYSCKNYKNGLQSRFNFSQSQQQVETLNNDHSLWSFAADTLISSSAYLFKNHNTGENELFFQDINSKIYLTSSTGNIVWKKQINEAIQSEIYVVDIFKNGKFQLLFNSANYIHLIDRNGNYVQGYPVKLPAEVTSPITLLDYDDNKDYRIFIACKDKRIYNYSIYGIKTEGFVPVKTNDEVKMPISYAKVGASDYLITADEGGKIYVFSRKGEGRIELKNNTISNLDKLYVMVGNSLSNTKLIYMDDKNNLLNKITLTDAKETVKFGDELNNFKSLYTLVNDDTQMDLLMFGDGGIYAYDLFSNKLFEYFNSTSFYTDVAFSSGSKSDYFLAFDKVGQKTEIIKVDGKLSGTLFSSQKPFVCNLYNNGRYYIININQKRISCNELN